MNGSAVLLTYRGITGLDQWRRFLDFMTEHAQRWGVWRWCATLEHSKRQKKHIHVMLQFRQEVDRNSKYFSFEGIAPNASTNDLCGEGLKGKFPQRSVDRGMFYVFADKVGTARDERGEICVGGTTTPAGWSARSSPTR